MSKMILQAVLCIFMKPFRRISCNLHFDTFFWIGIAIYENKQGRFWIFLKRDEFLWFFYSTLFFNIVEATIKDVTLGNYFNAACGFLLCVTIPFAPTFWKFAKEGYVDLVTYTTGSWNFIYTSWNACFVYAESPTYFASSLCILFAAELYPVIKGRPELYITSRIYTLAAHLLIRACYDIFPQVMNSSTWFNSEVLKSWGVINFVIIVPYLFWHMWQLHHNKAIISFKRGKVSWWNRICERMISIAQWWTINWCK